MRRGFTLVELIIATAITSIILSAIAGLFVLALRTVKSGNAAMDANELTRAAFAVIERDLNTAFTSREHGELFHFHGNEVGMSFIGLARTYDANANRDVVQLGRVTYVINSTLNAVNNGLDDDDNGVIDNAAESVFDLIYMERLDVRDGTTNGIDDDNDGLVDEAGEQIKEMVEAQLNSELGPGVRTVSLLRYFEPGVETLDEYDSGIIQSFEQASADSPNMQAVLDDALAALDLDNVRDAQIISQIERNFRRDAYIRMLANADDNFVYPDGWALLDPNPGGDPKNPVDYVIADNILSRASQKLLAEGDPIYTPAIDAIRFPYFLYGRSAFNASNISTIEYAGSWNANENVIEIIDNPRLTAGFGPPIDDDFDDDLDTLPDAWQTFGGIGTPLQARLPEIVRVRMPFVFDSPYAGAPHVQRELVQDIRVPSAFTRRNPLAGI